MKRLQITLLSVSILSISAFGINECAILFHKAAAAHLIQNTQKAWNHSIAETSDELTVAFGGKSKEEINQIEQNKTNQARYAAQAREAEEIQRQWRVNHYPDSRWDAQGHFYSSANGS